jgi:hypothetical protein
MSDINYGQFSEQANTFLEENNLGGSEFPLVYPSFGYLDVKIFINPNTPKVMWREIIEHEYDNDKKFPCMSVFGKPCDFCNAVAERGNLWKDGVKKLTRKYYFLYAVLNDYKLEDTPNPNTLEGDQQPKKQYKMPEKGSIVVLKLPLGAFRQITDLIKNGETANKILKPDGTMIRINNSPKIDFYYRIDLLEEELNVGTLIKESADRLISLEDFYYGKEPSDKILEKVMRKTNQFNAILDDIVRRVANNGDNPGGGRTMNVPASKSKPVNESPKPDEDVNFTKKTTPKCFGNHSKDNNKCFVCTSEEECMKNTKKGA